MTKQEEFDKLQAEIQRLERENALLRERKSNGFRLGVSEKGCVAIYGLRKFPVALYPAEMTALLDHEGEIRKFMLDHKGTLSTGKPL